MTVLRDLGKMAPLEELNITIKEIKFFLQGETGKSCSTSAFKQLGSFGTFSCFVNSKNKDPERISMQTLQRTVSNYRIEG
jgi:hypothetical protein